MKFMFNGRWAEQETASERASIGQIRCSLLVTLCTMLFGKIGTTERADRGKCHSILSGMNGVFSSSPLERFYRALLIPGKELGIVTWRFFLKSDRSTAMCYSILISLFIQNLSIFPRRIFVQHSFDSWTACAGVLIVSTCPLHNILA